MLLPLFALACGAEPAETALPQAAVPATPSMYVSELIEGETLTIHVTEAAPNATLYIGFSTVGAGNGPCPPSLGGFCIGLLSPQLLATVQADGNGDATFTGTVPTNLPATEVTFLALGGYGRSAYATPAITRTVQLDVPPPIVPCAGTAYTPDPFDTTDVRVEGNTLFVDVEYSGGCATHDFDACYNGFQTSLPVQVDLDLDHDANGDLCRALIFETRRFDLTPLGNSYPWSRPADLVLNYGRISTDYELP
jgi:hypothetical protein